MPKSSLSLKSALLLLAGALLLPVTLAVLLALSPIVFSFAAWQWLGGPRARDAVLLWLLRNIAWRRPPDVGFKCVNRSEPFLKRWNIVPRNPLLAVYLHNFLASDDIAHDHPYTFNASWILDGGYTEESIRLGPGWQTRSRRRFRPGAFVVRFGAAPHRVLVPPYGAWTIFITGPRFRVRGFHCPKGWIPWHVATGVDAKDADKFAKSPSPAVCP